MQWNVNKVIGILKKQLNYLSPGQQWRKSTFLRHQKEAPQALASASRRVIRGAAERASSLAFCGVRVCLTRSWCPGCIQERSERRAFCVTCRSTWGALGSRARRFSHGEPRERHARRPSAAHGPKRLRLRPAPPSARGRRAPPPPRALGDDLSRRPPPPERTLRPSSTVMADAVENAVLRLINAIFSCVIAYQVGRQPPICFSGATANYHYVTACRLGIEEWVLFLFSSQNWVKRFHSLSHFFRSWNIIWSTMLIAIAVFF